MSANIAALLYLVSGALFIMALRGLSSPATSRQGNIYGMIYAKRFPAATGSQVRLVIDAPVTQFDLFPPNR